MYKFSTMSMTYEQMLQLPIFLVNMDKCTDRLEISQKRIAEAGFTTVHRWKAVDAREDNLAEAWARHGSPKFNPTDTEFVTYPGKQGCMLSHLNIWKHIIDQEIPMAIVFEDDVEFHQGWSSLAPAYWAATPKNFDILYIGSQMEMYTNANIARVSVFCTHAYIITLEGARKLYSLLLHDPRGVSTIDCMLIDHMNRAMMGNPTPFEWYVWNARMFADPRASLSKDWAKRNHGLVFQDVELGTFVRPW
jgi:GR25 family glycosyltransferase involved in LPS biosynthesis